MDGPALLEIKCNKGARENLGRPTRTPLENKEDLMNFLSENEFENNKFKDKEFEDKESKDGRGVP